MLGTKNFEEILSAITISGNLLKSYPKAKHVIPELRTSYARTKESLVRAIENVHVPYGRLTPKLKTDLRRIFSSYDYIYTSNYDLLLYWAMASEPDQFKDFFWTKTSDGQRSFFDPFDVNLWTEKHVKTMILFLHGALHLGRDGQGTFKRLFRANDSAVTGLRNKEVPLFISEGSFRDKRAAIARNDYLLFAYNRFAKHRGSLVIFGHSLDPKFDQHLIEAMQKWPSYDRTLKARGKKPPDRRIVAVSVYSDDAHEIVAIKGRLAKALPDCDCRFFDSRTHPLGDAALTIS